MKAQLTFLDLFLKVLLMLLILALCFTETLQQTSTRAEVRQSSGTVSIKDVTKGMLDSVKLPRSE